MEAQWLADIRRRLAAFSPAPDLATALQADLREAPVAFGRWLALRHTATYGLTAPSGRLQAGRWVEGWIAELRRVAGTDWPHKEEAHFAYFHHLGQTVLYYLHDAGYAERARRAPGRRVLAYTMFRPEAVREESAGAVARSDEWCVDWPERDLADVLGWAVCALPPAEVAGWAERFVDGYRREAPLSPESGPFLYARMVFPSAWLSAAAEAPASKPEHIGRLERIARHEKKRTAGIARLRRAVFEPSGLTAPPIPWLERS
ncbi:MAG: hypothetical protein IMW86_01525 [Hydrogenibacillus sp.]|nr:hypothetical protein [Hydrogenibacillus sp.]